MTECRIAGELNVAMVLLAAMPSAVAGDDENTDKERLKVGIRQSAMSLNRTLVF